MSGAPVNSLAGRLSSWRLAVFAAIAVPIAGAGLPLAVYLPAFYAQTLGLTAVGAIFLLTRLWDTLSDPLVGVLSDHTRSRFGRRKPWIAVGAALFGASVFAIFFPPAGVSAVYLAGWLFAFYLGWTMIQVPLAAWSGELSAQYHERSRVQTFLQTAGAIGLLAVLVMPTILDQGRHAGPGASLRAMGLFSLATLVPAVIAGLAFVKEPARAIEQAVRLPFTAALKILLGDRLLLRILASDFAVTLGQSIRGSLFVFFVVAYLGLPKWASGLFLLQFVFGVFAAPLWLQVGYRLGKSRTAVAGEVAQVVINVGLLLAAPGPAAFAWVLGLTVAQGLAQGSGNLMLRSIVADLVDKQALETGQNRSGLLFSTFSLSGKLATAVAVGVALPLVGWLGFRPGPHNTPHALLMLKLVFALGPALSHTVSAILIARFPLDQRRHGEIQAAIAARAQLPSQPFPIAAE
jgi:GPH family glycoside/pentoside/hexuronide:cation symporter